MQETAIGLGTMADGAIVSVETQWKELNIFYSSLFIRGLVDEEMQSKYLIFKQQWEGLHTLSQEEINDLDKNVIDFKATLMSALAKQNNYY